MPVPFVDSLQLHIVRTALLLDRLCLDLNSFSFSFSFSLRGRDRLLRLVFDLVELVLGRECVLLFLL